MKNFFNHVRGLANKADEEGGRMRNQTQVVDEVFISYSRKDKAFVTRLYGILESKGRKPWVDWGMEPTERS